MVQARTDYERIKEREKELERIHRRSRELMNSTGRARDSSAERGGGERGRPRVLDHHCRVSAGPGGGGGQSPYFPPPPCHPPPPLSSAPSSHGRLKSSSPGAGAGAGKQHSSHSMRRRVISPNRKDYRNFTAGPEGGGRGGGRGGARSTDDEDSGADSMLEVRSTHSSQSCRSWSSAPCHPLVPYTDPHTSQVGETVLIAARKQQKCAKYHEKYKIDIRY